MEKNSDNRVDEMLRFSMMTLLAKGVRRVQQNPFRSHLMPPFYDHDHMSMVLIVVSASRVRGYLALQNTTSRNVRVWTADEKG